MAGVGSVPECTGGDALGLPPRRLGLRIPHAASCSKPCAFPAPTPRGRRTPGSRFWTCLPPWQMVSCAVLEARAEPAAAFEAAGASSPYFCGQARGPWAREA